MRLLKTFPAVALASSILVGGFGLPQTSNAQQISLSFGDSDRYDDYDDRYYGESNLAGDLLGAFLTGVVNHFGRSEQDVYLLQERGIRERELPVVFYLARQAGVSPMQIASMRASGYSWSDITYHFGLSSDIFYVPVSGNYYGPYASYYQMPRSRWSTLRLSDDAVIGLVNTRFLSDYYRAPVTEVWRYRSSGRDFPTLARHYYRPERHGQIRVWNRHKGNSSTTIHSTQPVQEPMQRVNEREELRQQEIRMERQERNREAALRRDARRSREVTIDQRQMTERQERNREAALRRDARQSRQLETQQRQMTERQERNREAVQRREARKQRQEQAQEQRQERRRAKAHKHEKKDKD